MELVSRHVFDTDLFVWAGVTCDNGECFGRASEGFGERLEQLLVGAAFFWGGSYGDFEFGAQQARQSGARASGDDLDGEDDTVTIFFGCQLHGQGSLAVVCSGGLDGAGGQ